ncbi:MAG: uroporphyrinogen-III C-methyltransferase [Planctomycetales bacterium]|nr:uroporphyrinogen-III C-methyltransferase [Planctomycetales bacterium]NIM09427.1 uroporphyrinogen-III C-methyltransferase [Planctomycetales bacterium]NIN08905.1 uroporphyrinogen-III C-methyltransferase [Planctomycetales bacterium]NIN78020.1 uroporphyrinogen-III C-methyltransferase [Planctomycetales bacterium]NIO35208.1 uroporphyrinogen-III C-methyltransferase [Planctomycetales bacterium]
MITSGKTGRVYLVGAGPGDPGLITVRGVQLLRSADVVVYDYLANPLILLHARAGTETICLGRHGQGRIMSQEEVNRLLVDRAAAGLEVVRLKCGDPAVFGRMAEELEALVAGKIGFEIVPGITAALAAPSLAGVPVTHRDGSSAVALVTGQEQLGQDGPPKVDFAALARFPGTLVFYMGITTAPSWSSALIEAGLATSTPAVIVRRCGWTDQQVIPATLGEVADKIDQEKLRPPAVVMIGQACRPETLFSWSRKRPLTGQTVLVTRPLHQAAEMCGKLVERGAGCMVQPAIAIEPPADWSPVDQALDQLATYDWLVFSSANGVRSLLDRIWQRQGDLRCLGDTQLAVIGPRTAEALGHYYLKADVEPAAYRAEALADALAAGAANRRFLLCRASRGRDVLAQRLTAAGGQVDQIVVYHSRDVAQPAEEVRQALQAGQVDWITVTSSAIARSLAAMFGDLLRRSRVASISPVTSETLRELGYPPHVEAVDYTTDGLIDAMVADKQSAAGGDPKPGQ